MSIINLSSCLYVALGETLMGVHSICGPWPRNSNLVTVDLGTFRHSSTLPAISMDFQKIKKTKQLTPSPRSTSQRGSNWTPPHVQASSSHPRSQPSLQSTMFIKFCQSGHSLSQIINCITYYPSIPILETEAQCNKPPVGT